MFIHELKDTVVIKTGASCENKPRIIKSDTEIYVTPKAAILFRTERETISRNFYPSISHVLEIIHLISEH